MVKKSEQRIMNIESSQKNNRIKRCSNSSVIRGLFLRAIILHLQDWSKLEKSKMPSVGSDVGILKTKRKPTHKMNWLCVYINIGIYIDRSIDLCKYP